MVTYAEFKAVEVKVRDAYFLLQQLRDIGKTLNEAVRELTELTASNQRRIAVLEQRLALEAGTPLKEGGQAHAP